MSNTERRISAALLERPQSNFATVINSLYPILECPSCSGTGEWLDPWEATTATTHSNPDPACDDDYYVTRHRSRASTYARWRCHKCGMVVNEPNVSEAQSTRFDMLAPAVGLYPACPMCSSQAVAYSEREASWVCGGCGAVSWEVDWVNYAGSKYKWNGRYKPSVQPKATHSNSSAAAELHADAYHRVADW